MKTDERYYKADSIKCRDGSKKFTKAQLNDDFCDCPDGTDEPEKGIGFIKIYEHGIWVLQEHQHVRMGNSTVGTLDMFRSLYILLGSTMDATENHENCLNEVVQSENSEEGSLNNGVEQDATEEEGSAVAHEADLGNKEKDESEISDSLSREDLGRIVGSRWTGKKSEQSGDDGAAKDDDHENPDDQLKDAHDEEYNAYDSETDDDSQTYDDDDADAEDQSEDVGVEANDDSTYPNKYESDEESDLSDITSTSSPSWLAKIQRTVKNILQAVNLFQTPVDKSGKTQFTSVGKLLSLVFVEAANVRKEYEESSAKLSKIQSRISSLTQKLKEDFGMYIKSAHLNKLPRWRGIVQHVWGRSWEKFEDSYRIMHFANGDKCWNGPDRSLKVLIVSYYIDCAWFAMVKLRCGLKNEVTDVGEPSRCEYEALLSTPAVCVEEKLKELQHKLDLMNKEQPEGHDEL
ncbi:hypothetical protein RJ639_022186 [Escallonia herrerae]|uniref:Glucosidase 2 subunit beta-like domain-containing protein n=1 Tax=Escallonia herrerae TaxID=1293975 RepID=A0AA88V7H6_9ASTE|nr:hypothetical protein RJ639_022186 [Escallonia herrerae]